MRFFTYLVGETCKQKLLKIILKHIEGGNNKLPLSFIFQQFLYYLTMVIHRKNEP